MRAEQDLQPFPERITDRLRHWALTVPGRTFMARRVRLAGGGTGDWQHVSYAQAWANARSIAQGLLDRGLDVERPVLILSENDLEHAVLALGCMLASVPFVPCSSPYSLVSQDFEKLRHVLVTTTPGLVFAADTTRHPHVRADDLGLPTPRLELKLVPVDGKTEVRYRGPNITPGYWRMPDATAQAFDEEGFFRTGDTVKWIDEADVHQSLKFDGRIAEDFKLATGTFVSVGPLRARFIAAAAPCAQDLVLTGLNLGEVGAMDFPNIGACRALSGLLIDAGMEQVLTQRAATVDALHAGRLTHFLQPQHMKALP